jgi:DAACS family dicarboxylate/amino acid:cation (Na+ or H+) symporter
VKLHTKLLIALVAGIACGTLLHSRADPWVVSVNTNLFQPIGQIFLRLIFMIVVPMVFSALVLGVFELGRNHGLGAVAGKTLLYTVVASTLSVAIGLVLVNAIGPGRGLTISARWHRSSLRLCKASSRRPRPPNPSARSSSSSCRAIRSTRR